MGKILDFLRKVREENRAYYERHDSPQSNVKPIVNSDIDDELEPVGYQKASRRPMRGIGLEFPDLPYDFSNVPFRSGRGFDFYLLDGENLQQAKEDVLSLNLVLEDAAIHIPQIRGVKIETVRFVPVPQYATVDFTWFSVNPYTETGRLSKYPMTLNFSTRRDFSNFVESDKYNPESYEASTRAHLDRTDIFGKIYYLGNGCVGKSEIILWHKRRCYLIDASFSRDGHLVVSKIAENVNGQKTIIYKV